MIDPIIVAKVLVVAIILFMEAIYSQMIKDYSNSENPF